MKHSKQKKLEEVWDKMIEMSKKQMYKELEEMEEEYQRGFEMGKKAQKEELKKKIEKNVYEII